MASKKKHYFRCILCKPCRFHTFQRPTTGCSIFDSVSTATRTRQAANAGIVSHNPAIQSRLSVFGVLRCYRGWKRCSVETDNRLILKIHSSNYGCVFKMRISRDLVNGEEIHNTRKISWNFQKQICFFLLGVFANRKVVSESKVLATAKLIVIS